MVALAQVDISEKREMAGFCTTDVSYKYEFYAPRVR
jgi:hypothetical protein